MCTSPCGISYDGSSPPVMSGTFFPVEDSESSLSHPRPPCDIPKTVVDRSMSTEPPELCQNTVVKEVDLFPSDLEIRDLFHDSTANLRFDFVKLSCLQCKRRFFSAGGLENHLFAVHGIRPDTSDGHPTHADHPSSCDVSLPLSLPPPELLSLGTTTGPPKCAPFTKLSPAKTWASVAAKPAITFPQPWAGKPPRQQSAVSTSPRRPRPTLPSRALGGPGQSPLPAIPPPAKKGGKSSPAFIAISHFAQRRAGTTTMWCMSLKRNLTDFTCLSAMPGHRTLMTALPKPPKSKPGLKKSKSLAFQNQDSTSASRQVHSSSVAASTTSAAPPIVCEYCDQGGFPSRKALKYHLFRLHGQPMRKASQQQTSSSSPQAQSATPAEPAHLVSSVQRLDAQISMSFPIQGKIVCPERGCEASFVSKHWTSMKGSLLKHLSKNFNARNVRRHFLLPLDYRTTPRRTFDKLLRHKLRRSTFRRPGAGSAPRKKEPHRPLCLTRHRIVSLKSQLLAPPVADVPFVEAVPQPSEHDDEPLFHFSQIFEDILNCDPSHDCAQILSDAYCQLVTEASSIALPKASVPAPFSQSCIAILFIIVSADSFPTLFLRC
ncbi:hypothetical protein CDAR_617771 [Caerostris darwini]|uniref:C2H2-type domain-containing protein n=1 Tax=Caerostris darwini TaxID=1538125 RepID=A0AAV4RP95_9ARAC|nr:hypothetical protein CDAR_617771 [Caerostris darwini]